MPSPKILFVNRMLSMERGGGETFDLEMARHLQHRGCEIAFLSGVPLLGRARIPNPAAVFPKPVANYRLRSPYFGWFPWDKTKGGWRLRLLDFLMFEWRAARWMLRHGGRFDVIQVCELPFLVTRVKEKGFTTPVVMRLTAPNFYDPWHGIQKADAVVASGETVSRVRAKLRPDCHDIPNAVDTNVFRPHPSPFRREHGLADDEFVVLYVARFQDFKNHALLVDAFAQLVRKVPRSRLVLIGKGPLKTGIERDVTSRRLADKVLFLGEQPFEKLPGIYAAADVMAISSDFESFCFAALEAMASGLPIVTTDCGWVPKLLGERVSESETVNGSDAAWVLREGGLVVPLRNASVLAAALEKLYASPERRRAMGARNRAAAVARHGWQASAEKLANVYRQLLEK